MNPLNIFTITLALSLFACNNRNTTNTTTESTPTPLQEPTVSDEEAYMPMLKDTTGTFVVDDYPVSDEMFASVSPNNSTNKKETGSLTSYDKIWLSNDTLIETIVFELYTDYHRLVTYHFYNNDIPKAIIKDIELHTKDNSPASEELKKSHIEGIINQAERVPSYHFTSIKGFKLGDSKQKAIDNYGNPDAIEMTGDCEILHWRYYGDQWIDSDMELNDKPIAINSFGHEVTMYFRTDKLIAQVLYNDVP